MTLAAGARLSPYEIVAPLGAGGMGEVYRARDAKLDRDVAIKFRSRARSPRRSKPLTNKGVTHRDLKPANIKLRPDGMVKVLDFASPITLLLNWNPRRTK